MVAENWVFERSSGYAGWRCNKCATWIYFNDPFDCKCNRENKEKKEYGRTTKNKTDRTN